MRASTRSLVAACFGLGLAFVLIFAASITGLAQSDNTQISGFVKDQNGAVIAGAKVTVRSEAKVFERTSTTSSEGYFIVPNLPPGLYTVSVEAQGFKQYKETGRKLDPNIAANVEISLQAGQLTETVQITASTVAIQTESSTVGRLIEGKQIEALQLNGRNPLFLALLKPGVSGGALGQFNFGLTTGGLNINGARTQDNLITYDGAVGVRTRSNGTSIGTADLDSTQEIQVLTANYNAEYGRSSGGQYQSTPSSRTCANLAFARCSAGAMRSRSWGTA